MDDDLRSCLYDPAGAHDLVLARRPPVRSAVHCVVSDVVWTDAVRLLRWAAAGTHGSAELQAGTWWRLAAGCADLLRRFPGLTAEVAEPWSVTAPPEAPTELPGPARVTAAAARLAALLRSAEPVALWTLAAAVDALGAAAIGALAEQELGAVALAR